MKRSLAESFVSPEFSTLCNPDADMHAIGVDDFGTIPILGPTLNGHPIRFYDPTTRECENAAAIGGMKNPASSIMRAKASHLELGQYLYARIEKVIGAAPTLRSQCLDALGNPIAEGPDVKFVTFVHRLLQSELSKFIRKTGRSVPTDIQMGQTE
eukprot:669284-Amphidinium_carterae.2